MDDNETSREVLLRMMRACECQAEAVASAPEALEALRCASTNGEPIDTVIIDRHMPGIDGRELGSWIKRDPLLENSNLLMMGSVTGRSEAPDLRRQGFLGYLTKPVKSSQLFRALLAVGDGGSVEDACLARHEGPDVAIPDAVGRGARILAAEDNPTNQLVIS